MSIRDLTTPSFRAPVSAAVRGDAPAASPATPTPATQLGYAMDDAYVGASAGRRPPYAVLGDMNGADVEAMAFATMMAAAGAAREDLKAMMNEVKAARGGGDRIRTVRRRDGGED